MREFTNSEMAEVVSLLPDLWEGPRFCGGFYERISHFIG
jgi:hypothetical protein